MTFIKVRMTRLVFCLVAGLAWAAVSSNARSSVVEKLTDQELVREAGFIIRGRVLETTSQWNADQTQIFTFVTLAVDRQLKGESLGATITLRALGGYADGLGMMVHEAPVFEKDEEVILFLEPNPQSMFPVAGFNAGKLTVHEDAATGRKMIRERGIEADAFLQQVEAMVAGQAVRSDGSSTVKKDADDSGIAGAGPVIPSDDVTFYKFRLSGIAGAADPLAGPALAPHAVPPFIHWDLREFPNCTVPYSFFDGTADVPSTMEFDEVDQAFLTWQGITPAIIVFERRLPGPGATCPLIKDKHNMIGWDGFACMTVGDDTCLLPANTNDDVAVVNNLVCGATVAANAILIGPGVNMTIETIPNNCPGCLGDDFQFVDENDNNLPKIKDGGNGKVDTVLPNTGCVCHLPLNNQAEIVGPGPDGWLTTQANNCCDDFIKTGLRNNVLEYGIWDGGNGLRETIAIGGDMNIPDQDNLAPIFCYCRVNPGQLLVRFASLPETPPNNCCDDEVVDTAPAGQPAAYKIKDGGDKRVTTKPGMGLAKRTLALTANFYEGPRENGPNSGRILESDILFNDTYAWQILGNAQAMGGNPDIRTVALHEIGHWFGLHHANNTGVSNPHPILDPTGEPIIMNPALDRFGDSMQIPHPGDITGINFLYSPDLGDAPDPVNATFNEYQTLVHSTVVNPGRTLNGVQLFEPGLGPVHLYGHKTGAGMGAPAPRFEWLGVDEDGHQSECEARVPDMDSFDDGVKIVDAEGNVLTRLTRGQDNLFEVVISHTNLAGRYVNNVNEERRRLYFNGYLDFDGNDVFDTDDPGPSDLEMWWTGIPDPCMTFDSLQLDGNPVCDNAADPKTIKLRFKVPVPQNAPNPLYGRFRLDWGEDLGFVEIEPDEFFGVSGDLLDGEGAAQFGEVEDYAFDVNGDVGKCEADIDPTRGDGQVDINDLFTVLAAWGPCPNCDLIVCHADIDGDCVVEIDDLTAVIEAWGPCP